MSYDVAVIGSGPGGYVAAIRAAQLDLRTICFEKDPSLGGTCLNVGCIPSKALLYTTEIYTQMKHSSDLGLVSEGLSINFDTMMNHKQQVVKGLTDGVRGLFKKNGVELKQGIATLKSPNEIAINNEVISVKNIILATGSAPIALPFLPFDEKIIVSSTGALALPSIPKTMVIIGAGVIGVEIASVYQRLGSKVILIEMLDHICGNLDHTIHQNYLKLLQKQGLEFHLSTQVKKGEVKQNQVYLETQNGNFTSDVVLVAVGRKPYSEGLKLENAGVQKNPKGFVIVDDAFRTNIPNIYAIGDIIDGPMLAHRASEEGVVVAELIAGHASSIDYMTLPNVIYTHPEVATVGLTEQEAKDLSLKPVTGTCIMKANARARCMGDTDGMVKVIGDSTSGKLLGIHILAPQASEMIGEAVIAIQKRMTLEELANSFHAHPTLSEAIKEACLVALKRPINI